MNDKIQNRVPSTKKLSPDSMGTLGMAKGGAVKACDGRAKRGKTRGKTV